MTCDVLKGLNDRNIESHVTPTSLKQQIKRCVSEFGIHKILAVMNAGTAPEGPAQSSCAPGQPLHFASRVIP